MEKRKRISLLLALILIMQIILPTISLITNKVIAADEELVDLKFKDENLFNALKTILADKIRISSGPNAQGKYVISMTQANIDDVTKLELNEKGISNIEGIEGFRKLQYLYLQDNQIINIDIKLPNTLTWLDLRNNKITNIDNVVWSDELGVLLLGGNYLSSIDKITWPKKIWAFSADNQISNIDNVKWPETLTWLSLGNNQITNIDSLSNLTSLAYLSLGNNQITNIDSLSKLTNLTKLYLDNNNIEDISVIKNFTKLKHLDASGNKISTFESQVDEDELPTMGNDGEVIVSNIIFPTTLEELHLNDNKITDIHNLVNLTNLKTLELQNNYIEDISSIENLSNLTTLDLTNQTIVRKVDSNSTSIELPQILKAALQKTSKAYSEEGILTDKGEIVGTTLKYDKSNIGSITAKVVGGTAKDTTLYIENKEITVIEIEVPPTKTIYKEGENFDSAGMKVVATYTDGTTKEVTDYTVVGGEKLTIGTTKVTINYKEGKVTKKATQKIIVTHDYEDITTEPTCTEKGNTKQKCKVCGQEVIKNEIAALGHDYKAVVTAPTCTEKGYTTHTCTRCKDTYVNNETAALGHNYENGVCTRCGTQEPSLQITSEEYSIDDKHNYIKNIEPRTTVQEIKWLLTTNATEIKLYKGDKELEETDVIGTNTKIYLKNAYGERTLTIIVTGDTDGNGLADFWDMIAINKHRLGIEKLGNTETLAGDVTGDGITNFWDMLTINKFRLGILKTL